MKFYGIDMQGPLQLEAVATLPVWTSADERRLIYNEADDKVYIGTAIGWVEIGSGGGGTPSTPDDTLISAELAGVDLTVVAQTPIYTVPSGKLLVVDKLIIICESVTTPGSLPTVQLGTSLINNDIIPAGVLPAGLTTVDSAIAYDVSTDAYGAGEIIELGVTVGGGSATHTAKVILRGHLIDV